MRRQQTHTINISKQDRPSTFEKSVLISRHQFIDKLHCVLESRFVNMYVSYLKLNDEEIKWFRYSKI